MAGELSKYTDIKGKVVSLSHTFRIYDRPLFIIEMENNISNTNEFVFVRGMDQLPWHKKIYPGFSYCISNLREDMIYKGKYDVKIYLTSRLSSISLIKKGSYDFATREEIKCDLELISFQRCITSVIDEDLGIYELGDIILITSYLKDVTAELSKQPHKGDENSRHERSATSFKVGDELSIYNAHCIKGRDGTLSLVCCGKSLIRNKRISAAVYECNTTTSGILHCLHTFSLGINFLYWLWGLQKMFIDTLFKDELEEKITRRKWNNEEGLLVTYVEEQLKDLKKNKRESRSSVLEFLLSNHSCVIQQAFDGFIPTSFEHLLNYEFLPSNENNLKEVTSVWTYSTLGRTMHEWVIFGKLIVSSASLLQLKSNDEHIDIVISGSKETLYAKLGQIVAVHNFDFVKEEFHLFEGKFERRYIVTRAEDFISIGKALKNESTCTDAQRLNYYEIKVTALSGLNYFANDLKKEVINSFFVVSAFIYNKDAHNKIDTWNDIVRFKGKTASKLHPFLTEPCIIYGKTQFKNKVDCSFRKSVYFSFMKQFHKQFGTLECTEVPEDFQVDSVTNLFTKATDSIKNILQGTELNSTYFNIEGKMLEKWFMSPRYNSQLIEVPENFLKEGIGTPGSKVIRLLVQDKDDPGFTIWVYFFTGNPLHLPQYNLGLIPGTEINISWLERCVSKKGSIYLKGNSFSVVTVLNFGNSRVRKVRANHHFISEMALMPSGSVVLIFSTVSCILDVNLKIVCAACKTEMENDICGFLGCHSDGSTAVSGYAKIIVDDGTGVASMFIKDMDLIKTLIRVNDTQWGILTNMARRSPLRYKFQFLKSKKYSNRDEEALAKLLTNPQIFRPLKITCRLFPIKEGFESSNWLELFAIELADINPITDVMLFKTKV